MSSILVIGESCLDKFIYCESIRLAPDIPVPVVCPVRESENPGMAMNVWRNLKSLGAECDIVTNSNWREVTKTRIVHEASNHTFLRIDSNDKVPRSNFIKKDLLDTFELVVVADYNKNFLSNGDIQRICEYHDCVFLDTKKVLGPWAEGAKFIKINNYEYRNSLPFLTPILQEKIIWTDGASGANYRGVNYPTIPVEVKDSSGAGDAFMAGLVASYILEKRGIEEAIFYANGCARKVVSERGVTTI